MERGAVWSAGVFSLLTRAMNRTLNVGRAFAGGGVLTMTPRP